MSCDLNIVVVKLNQCSAYYSFRGSTCGIRNSVNVGLMLIECDTDKIREGDSLAVDIAGAAVHNKTTGAVISARPMPDFMLRILKDGGLVRHFKRHGGFKIDV